MIKLCQLILKINIFMKAKTIQYMSPIVFVNTEPNFDRLKNEEPLRSILVDLINRGEIPRYRGDECSIKFNDNATIIEIIWNSRLGAEEYVSRLLERDPSNQIVFKIDIEDLD